MARFYVQKCQKWTCNCFRFVFYFLETFVQQWKQPKKNVIIHAIYVGICWSLRVFNISAKITHFCPSDEACLHASQQQRKVKSSVIVCVSFTHTRRPMNPFLLTKNHGRGLSDARKLREALPQMYDEKQILWQPSRQAWTQPTRPSSVSITAACFVARCCCCLCLDPAAGQLKAWVSQEPDKGPPRWRKGWGIGSVAAWDWTRLNGYQLTDIDAFQMCTSDGGGGGVYWWWQRRVIVCRCSFWRPQVRFDFNEVIESYWHCVI